MSREVVLCFLPLDSDLLESSYLNYLAGKIAPRRRYNASPPMVHVEIWLKQTPETGMAASICYNKTVHYCNKAFSRVSWAFRSMFVTEQQFSKLNMFLSAQKGNGFNRLGFFMLGLGLRIPGNWACKFGFPRRYFCAELVIRALKASGCIAENSLPDVSHPEELFQMTSLITCPTTIRDYAGAEVRY